jgi:hypothetical protein
MRLMRARKTVRAAPRSRAVATFGSVRLAASARTGSATLRLRARAIALLIGLTAIRSLAWSVIFRRSVNAPASRCFPPAWRSLIAGTTAGRFLGQTGCAGQHHQTAEHAQH